MHSVEARKSAVASAPDQRGRGRRPCHQQALADCFAKILKREMGRRRPQPRRAGLHRPGARGLRRRRDPRPVAGGPGQSRAGFWRFAAKRDDADPKVRLSTAVGAKGRDLGLDVLEIVQDDAPFLVDSVMGEIAERGYPVRAMFHPVVEVGRDTHGRARGRAAPTGANR